LIFTVQAYAVFEVASAAEGGCSVGVAGFKSGFSKKAILPDGYGAVLGLSSM
jgi:hypothetical protein